MKPLNENELYHNLRGFLKGRGIELQEGSYARGIQKSCSLLSDAINLGQQGLGRAKTEIDKKLEQMRQVIHEKTAPKTSGPPPAPESKGTASQAPGPKTNPKLRRRKKTT